MMKRLFYLAILLMTITITSCSGLDLSGAAGAEKFGSQVDQAMFMKDVTIPDFTVLEPGESFSKTWRLLNSGATTWNSNYKIVFISGAQMGAPASTALPEEVSPNESIDLTLDMTAPMEEGNYTGNWMLRAPDGTTFGLGDNADEPFYVSITVVDPNSSGGVEATSGPSGVTRIDFSTDKEKYAGSCPANVHFEGTIYYKGSGTVSYELEAESGTPNFTFVLPEPYTFAFEDTGKMNKLDISYDFSIQNSMTGWVRVHVISPESMRSEKVMITVDCQ